MTRLSLPQVTLVCVDTRTPELGLSAVQSCMAQADFGAALLFTTAEHLRVLRSASSALHLVAVDVPDVAAYSHFMLRDLLAYVQTSHALVVQWDGYILDTAVWTPEFLDYDYVGAPWPDAEPGFEVGNGGFSLRSRRLLEALQDESLSPRHPEDVCIGIDHRKALIAEHGIRFAPPELASRFAYERSPKAGSTFGFHGLFNLHHEIDPPELRQLLLRLPDTMMGGLDALHLAEKLIELGRLDDAGLILQARRRLGMRDRRTLRLRLKMAWAAR
jgi:Protein of unknown function (DUF5672)